MPIAFDAERWARVRDAHARWWNGELDRPLIQVRIGGEDPGRKPSAEPFHHFTAFYDLSVSAEAVVDAWDYHLSQQRYLGDAFPTVWPNFGAGVVAAFLGAQIECGRDTVWFHAPEQRELRDLQFHYDPDNVWLRRIKDICRAALDRWDGLVQIGMTDLGGALDILSTFRPGEQLLLDLFDAPDEVNKRVQQIHEFWWRAFDEIDDVLRPRNPGYTAWTPIFSETSYYMLQSDFAYMIGPDMFDHFVKDELAASCRRLDHGFYHLDGVGQLAHLDSLLEIPQLKGVQWIPGDGQPGQGHWPDVYRKIKQAGRRIQVFGMAPLDAVAEQTGGGEGIVAVIDVPAQRRGEAEAFLAKWGAA